MSRHSRRRFSPKGERRRTVWHDGRTSTTSLSVAAGVVTELLLFIPLSDEEAATVTRIVGTIALWNEASPVIPTRLSWGIYHKLSGTVSDLSLNPQAALDMESEQWLMTRHIWTRGTHASLGSISDTYEYQSVDIKVQRKVDEGEAIALVLNGQDNYVFAANLRVLLKLT